MDIRIWNVFHDGTIVRVEGAVPGEVILGVEIDYLIRLLVPPCALFLIHLQGCDFIELQSWADDSLLSTLPAIEQTQPEILSGHEEGDLVSIFCSGYTLRLRYTSVHVRLDRGDPIAIEESKRSWRDTGRSGRSGEPVKQLPVSVIGQLVRSEEVRSSDPTHPSEFESFSARRDSDMGNATACLSHC